MTGRERRDGPPLMVNFVYVLICIAFVVLWNHRGSVFNWVLVVQLKCIYLGTCCNEEVYLIGYLLYRGSVFMWVPVVPRKCI
jgi:hypothetical protein